MRQKMTSLQKLKLYRNFFLVLLIAGILATVGFVGFFWYIAKDLPAPNQVVRQDGYGTKIFDRDGELLYDFYQDQRREPFTLDEVGQNLMNATIAVEDKDFYNHGGFDFFTILRIPYYYFTQQRVVGGSTLTQQLTKMMLLSNERSIVRKFRELILSMQIEKMFTKEKILEMYLNESPYTGNVHGAKLAAEILFKKSMQDLTIAEAATLAGLPQSPNRYSPFAGRTDPDGNLYWRERAKGVLRRMWEDGYISDTQLEEAEAELQTFVFQPELGEIKAPHFVFYVEEQLREQFGDEMVDNGGLVVHTSLDYDLQASAEGIVQAEIAAVADQGISNGAALVLAPKTGEILSMVGSKDYFSQEIDGQFNVTANPSALRQPGSSIKPLVYLALMQFRAATPAKVFADVPTTFQINELIEPYTPKNYDGKFRGPVNLREALGNSYNIPAVKALGEVGMETFLSFAYNAGISTFAPTPANLQRLWLSLALGGGEVRMIEMAGAYAGFANGGYKIQPTAILKVENVHGNVIYENKYVQNERIFNEGETFLINNILSDNNARTAAFGANSLLNTKLPIAVKTGTTNSMKDNWTIGWSPSFLVHVWVGNNDGTPMKSVASGITGASPIWRSITDKLVSEGYETPEWSVPSNVEKVMVDAVSGFPEHDGFPAREEYFVKNTLGTLPDPIHAKLHVCKGQNKLATSAQLARGDSEEKEFIVLKENDYTSEDGVNRIQIGIDNWIAEQGDERYRFPVETCGDEQEVSISIFDLQDKSSTNDNHLRFRVRADSGAGIERIEVYRDGEKKDEKTDDTTFDIEWRDLERGVYEIYAKAYSRDGQTRESSKFKVGVGGETVPE